MLLITEKISGRRVIGNVAASGTEIIHRLGPEHERTGALIVYTSADSVLQIAAHENVVPVAELYRICQAAHEHLLPSASKVARVIARPFVGEHPAYQRTSRRRDFSVQPGTTLLNRIVDSGGQVLAVGKIADIFAGSGISRSWPTRDNRDGMDTTIKLTAAGEGQLIFTNLVDFDSKYGHRNDPQGYARALQEFDQALPSLMQHLKPGDLLLLVADHGCDPTTPGTDHSREYVPCLAYHRQLTSGAHLPDGDSLCYVGATVAAWLGMAPWLAAGILWGMGYASD